jgi:hypothetical protein
MKCISLLVLTFTILIDFSVSKDHFNLSSIGTSQYSLCSMQEYHCDGQTDSNQEEICYVCSGYLAFSQLDKSNFTFITKSFSRRFHYINTGETSSYSNELLRPPIKYLV